MRTYPPPRSSTEAEAQDRVKWPTRYAATANAMLNTGIGRQDAIKALDQLLMIMPGNGNLLPRIVLEMPREK